jgi:hypothetical protein
MAVTTSTTPRNQTQPPEHDRMRVQVERASATHFGIKAYGVHVNGFVRDPADGSVSLWVARWGAWLRGSQLRGRRV